MSDYEEVDYDDEYEIVPLTPLRRLEERIKELEETKGTSQREFVLDVMDLVKSNQKLVDEVVKANHSLQKDIQDLVNQLKRQQDDWREFMELLMRTAEEEEETGSGEEVSGDLGEKFDRLIELNEKVLESNEELRETIEESGPRRRGRSRRRKSGTSDSKYPKIRVRRSDEQGEGQ